jgi:tetratricopeptide (TPR) repeat protein
MQLQLRAPLALSLALLISVIAAPVTASPDDDQKACSAAETKADDGIAACGRQIEAKARELALSYHSRGLFWFSKKELDKAIADYSKAIELDSNLGRAYHNRADALSAKGDFDRAIADYGDAIWIDGKGPVSWNNRGLAHKAKGNFARAIADFDQAIKLDPNYTAAFTNRGQTYEARAKADLDHAKVDYKAALALPQKYPTGRSAHDTARARLAELEPALVRPTPTPPSIPVGPTFADDQRVCNSSRSKPDDGIAACTRQIASGRWTGHNLAISYYNRGIFWYDKDEPDKAIEDYNKAIELSPNYASAFNNRGNAWAAKGDLDRAIADYNRAIEIDGKDPFRWNNRGLAWRRKGDYDRAIADFDQAIKVDPGYTAAYTNRGQAYEDKGEIARAKADYRAALAVPQKYGNGRWAHDRARERLAALPADTPSSPPSALPPRASAPTFEEDQKACNSSDTKLDDGIAACTRQIASGRWQGHDLAISYYNRGIFWYDKEENDKAIADYTKAIELSPNYASAYNNRGNAYSAKGDLDRALADYDKAIHIDPKDPFRWNNRGLIWKRKGDLGLAIFDFDQAIKIDPGYTAAYTNRGQAHEEKGEVENAKADYRAALAVPQKYSNGKWAHDKARERLSALGTPEDLVPPGTPRAEKSSFDEDQKLCNSSDTPIDAGIAACTRQIESGRWKGHNLAISYYNRGIFYYDKDDLDKAIADYTKAIELSPEYSSAFNNRGNAWSAKGDLDKALVDYDNAIRIDGKDPFRWNNRGLIWRRKGEYDRAIADFDQAIKIDPGYTAAYTNRGQAYEGKGDTERALADYKAALAVPQKYSNGKYAHDKARERLAALLPPSPPAPPAPKAE